MKFIYNIVVYEDRLTVLYSGSISQSPTSYLIKITLSTKIQLKC